MKKINEVKLEGRIGYDPKVFTTKDGKEIISISFSIQHSKKSGDQWIKSYSNFQCVDFDNRCNSKIFTKGDIVIVQGSIQMKPFTGKDGTEKLIAEIFLSNISRVEKKSYDIEF